MKRYISIYLFIWIPLLALARNEIGTSLYSGKMYFSIPIYTIEDPDFHLDISLQYGSDGFKPFQSSGCYGQDWSLKAGGCITRTVMGVADEQKTDYSFNAIFDKQIGMLQAIKEGGKPDKDSVFDFTTSLYKPTCGIQYYQDDYIYYSNSPANSYCEWDRDYMPDIYTFSFCGYNGKFIIDNSGKPVVISGDFVKIDLSDFKNIVSNNSGQNSFYNPTDSSSITIQTTDGYSYIFGGSKQAMEYYTSIGKNETLPQPVPAISAWHLTKIIAPNDRYITLSYVNEPLSNNHRLQSFITDYDWTEKGEDSTHIAYFLHKESLLASIKTSDSIPLEVFFISNEDNMKKYDNSDFIYSTSHLKLDSVIVSCAGRRLRTAGLSYQYRSYHDRVGEFPNYNWRYLNEVFISGIGKYTMEYLYLLPNALYLYPSLNPTTNASYKAMVDRWGFWKVTSLQGMLSEVFLPTGGKYKFTYGSHKYGEERRYKMNGKEDVELYTHVIENQTIGGARIEKIETFSNDSTIVETKTYSYYKSGSDVSSGVFYNKYEIFDSVQLNVGYLIIHPDNYGINDSHVGYSYVEQTTIVGNETHKTAYTFDTGVSTYSSMGNSSINRNDSVPSYIDSIEIRSGSLTYPSNLIIPGHLMAIDQYEDNSLIKKVLYEYNGIPNNHQSMLPNQEITLGCTDTIVVLSKHSGHIARKLFVFPNVLEKKVIYEYEGNSEPMVTDITYTYDRKFRKKKETFNDSQSRRHFTKYTYPDDLPFSYSLNTDMSVYFILKQRYQINKPIETVTGFYKGDMEYITGGVIQLYVAKEYGVPHPSLPIYTIVYQPCLQKTMTLSLKDAVTDYQAFGIGETSFVYDSRYHLECEYDFNWSNRLLYIKPAGQSSTTYTWEKEDAIYPSSITTNNQTISYSYIPYVGIRSKTDQKGITTYYTYDSVGRLIEEYQIIEGRKQILNVYRYHIKTE